MFALLLHPGVDISEGALVAAASLSARYINGRFLPDKVGFLAAKHSQVLRLGNMR
jgi:ATP-dependent Clp protease ATP-binding subunit ClpA